MSDGKVPVETFQERKARLETIARWFFDAWLDGNPDSDGHCKSYDPMQISMNPDGTIHIASYVWSESGRYTDVEDLDAAEAWLRKQAGRLFEDTFISGAESASYAFGRQSAQKAIDRHKSWKESMLNV